MVFAVSPEYLQEEGQSSKQSGRKRKPTPASEGSLRRSKRNKALNDGFRPSSPAPAAKRVVGKKVAALQSAKAGKSSLFPIPQAEFPDLALIDRIINDAMVHPHIPIDNLQKVARETCGIPPMEVSKELLLADQGPGLQGEADSSSNMQIVPYGP
jgi:hypothetical protein